MYIYIKCTLNTFNETDKGGFCECVCICVCKNLNTRTHTICYAHLQNFHLSVTKGHNA